MDAYYQMASSSHNRDIGAVRGGQGLESTPANSTTMFEQARRRSSSGSESGVQSGPQPVVEGGLLDKAKDKLTQMKDAVKDQMHTGTNPTHMRSDTGGGVTQKAQTTMDNTMESIGKHMGGNTHGQVGGPQLFGDPKGSMEGQAGNKFLSKYTHETAPGENTS